MITDRKIRHWYLLAATFLCLHLGWPETAGAQMAMTHGKTKTPKAELGAAAVSDASGRVWVVTREAAEQGKAFLIMRFSPDMGQHWSAGRRVQAEPEPIAADGESRPKLALGAQGQLYISYTKPLSKPYTGEIRFVRSDDGGQTFSAPLTVHANRDEITHRFDSLLVDRSGRIFVAWIDKRDGEVAKARKETYAGAAIYYAVSADGGRSFQGDYKIADHSCECCRIGLTLNPDGVPMAMWRHVFEPDIRDHALRALTPDGSPGKLVRATFDDWHVNACPHHGPSLAYGADGRRHQTWFAVRGDTGGVFYAASKADGSLGEPVKLGSAQAEHPDVLTDGNQVVVVWKQFDGQQTMILSRISPDGGAQWEEKTLATTTGNSDQPHLFQTPEGIAVLWNTQNEGVRILRTGKDLVKEVQP